MKTKIVRRILAAMVAAATLTSISGVASAVKKKNNGSVGISTQSKIKEKRKVRRFKRSLGRIKKSAEECAWDTFSKMLDKAEKGENDKNEAADVVAGGIWWLVVDFDERKNLNVQDVINLLNRCSEIDNPNARLLIVNSIKMILRDGDLHNALQNRVSTILEILQRCAEANAARGAVCESLDTLAQEGLLGAAADAETAQNIYDTIKKNNNN